MQFPGKVQAEPACFNEATTDQSWKFRHSFGTQQIRLASMRPRLISRGNKERSRANTLVLRASMRPRLISRGNAIELFRDGAGMLRGLDRKSTRLNSSH